MRRPVFLCSGSDGAPPNPVCAMHAALAWICSLLGAGVMYVVLLGNAMSTAPSRLPVGVLLGLAVLPVVALAAAGVGLSRFASAQAPGRGALLYLVPLVIAGLTVLLLARELTATLWSGSGAIGPPVEITYTPDGETPFYAMEIRPARDDPSPGFTEMIGERFDRPVYVADDVLFTNADVAATWTEGPSPIQGYVIGLTFTESAQPRVEDLSREYTGERWAVLLNGELFVAPRIAEPFRERVLLANGFNETAAGNFARGIVRRF